MALLWHCYTYVKGKKGGFNRERTKKKQTALNRLTL